jgi:hypothetical protein
MPRHLQIKLACSAALLAVGMAALTAGAQLGVVHLNAGDMTIVLGPSDGRLTMDIASRACPPDCGIDIAWRPLAKAGATLPGANLPGAWGL